MHTFAGIYDLVKLMNGVNVQIASGTLPSGQIEYIRLKLGDNNSATVDGVVFQLATPGEHHPGLKIPVSKNLVTGGSEEVLIDFDLFRSVVEQSNGSWQFNPVIRLVDKAVHESASGLITPASATSAIVFNSNGQRYASFSNDEGYFMVQGIPSGTYTVTVTPDLPLVPAIINDVLIQSGTNKDMGIINF